GPWAANAVVDADVVCDRRSGRAPLDVDTGARVLVDRIRDDPGARGVGVVDAMAAVAVDDVVVDQCVVRARTGLDPGVLVVVREVAGDDVAWSRKQMNAGGGPLVAKCVGKGLVRADCVAG